MAKRIYDLAVKTGSYQSNDGQTKNRYETVGMVMEDDKGGRFMLLKRCFNPAGVEYREGKDSIMVSMFEPRERGEGGNGGGERSPTPASQAPKGSLARKAQEMLGGDNDIPF